MQQQTITVTIAPEQQDQVLSVPLDIDGDIARLDISYVFDKNLGVIDLGFEKDGQLKGWSGGKRTGFCVMEHHATPGYQKGLGAGKYAVLLGTYRVHQTLDVTITITTQAKGARWYKGDLHSHTNHSDGDHFLWENALSAHENGLDFLARSDHNVITQHHPLHMDFPLLLIPAMELTTTQGHANFFGEDLPLIDFRDHSQEGINKAFAAAHDAGAIIAHNHPFCPYCPWLRDFNGDMLEIWNGAWALRNEKTRQYWYDCLEKGKFFPIIGGSDFHKRRTDRLGDPCTHVYAEEYSIASILTALRQGRSYITARPNLCNLNITHQGQMCLGQELPAGAEIHLEVSAAMLGATMVLRGAQGEEARLTITKANFDYSHKLTSKFLTIEIWEATGTLLLISNPIFMKD